MQENLTGGIRRIPCGPVGFGKVAMCQQHWKCLVKADWEFCSMSPQEHTNKCHGYKIIIIYGG